MKHYQSFLTMSIGVGAVIMHNFAEMDCILNDLGIELQCQLLPIFWIVGYFLMFMGLIIFALEWKMYKNQEKKKR